MSEKETSEVQGLVCDPIVAADFARAYLNEDERHGMIERNLGLVKVVVDRMKLFCHPLWTLMICIVWEFRD